MERTRPSPPSHEESAVPSLPAEAPPLAALVEGVRGLVVLEKDVDALAEALARPPVGEETPRARADLLLALLEDAKLGQERGSDGRSVHTVAVDALLALGFPYALELPPEALARARAERGAQAAGTPVAGLVTGGLGVLAQLALVVPVLVRAREVDRVGLGMLLAVLGTLVLPTLLAALGGWQRLRGPRRVGVGLMGLVGLGWLGAFVNATLLSPSGYVDAWELAFAGPGALLLASAWLLRQPWGEEEP